MTTEGKPATTGTDRGRRSIPLHPSLRTVRARILVWVVALTALGLGGAGAAAYVLEDARIDRRIDDAIRQEIKEFEQFQAQGVDPRAGGPFTSVDRLLQVALRRNVPDEQQAIIGFVNGRPAYVHPGKSADLAENRAFVDAVNAMPASGYGRLESPEGEIRYAVKTILQEGSTQGAYVVAYFTAQERAEFLDVVRTYAIVALLAVLAVSVSAWSVAGRLLRPVRDLRATAQEISDTDLTRRINVEGNDDLSDLASTFNAMLDRLEEAFATQRRFLDDAGHELRTPITIVRGHLELVDPNDPQEVEATRALVLDEVDRMSRLVEDLIVLAKARRPDFLRLQPVDVGALTDEVFDKVRPLAGRTWQLDARASGCVLADSQRLTQALLQLASNARHHTEGSDVIGIGSSADAHRLRLWVRDTGPGVPPEYAGRIFERFERGPNPRRRDGSGLGLSIVRAIAEAHGGRVDLLSTPGKGATFVIDIPRRDVSAPRQGTATRPYQEPAPYPAEAPIGGQVR